MNAKNFHHENENKKMVEESQPVSNPERHRIYKRSDSIVFMKTKESFGGLSNMAGGFPLNVNRINIRTSEALYQACRFPHNADLQNLIISQASPMSAKMKSKPSRGETRSDWDAVRVKVMRWCLRVKLAQNWESFSALLLQTGGLPIVEESGKDDFWGAKPTSESTLAGENILGRLLMELRDLILSKDREYLLIVLPLSIENFLLENRTIGIISSNDFEKNQHAASQADLF